MLDTVIVGARIYDGTGAPPFEADLGILDGKIARIGAIDASEAHEVVAAGGCAACPGFIDTHSHSDVMALWEPELLPKVMQGITTELLGQDGVGPAPLKPSLIGPWRSYLAGLAGNPPVEWTWESFDDYLARLEAAPTGPNLVSLVPYGNVRMRVAGLENVPLSPAMTAAMEREIVQAMDAGAVGMSLGMVYMPCTFASREELVRAFAVCGRMGGFMAVHMRNGSDLLLESIAEIIDISTAAPIPLHISHFKAAGARNWHKMEEALAMVDDARARGLDVTFDIYPYTAGSTMFSAVLPPWVLEGGMTEALARLRNPSVRQRILQEWTSPPPPDPSGAGWDNHAHLTGWDNIVISSARNPEHPAVGKSVADFARGTGRDSAEAALDLLLEEDGDVGMIMFSMNEDKVAMGIRHPAGMICTDGLLGGKPHPRVYGAFPRVLAHHVRERRDLTLAEAIRKMTSFPAARLGLEDRGILREGMAADIVVFSPVAVCDRATYENSRQYPEGIAAVFVNGVHIVKDGRFSGNRAGRVLRRGRMG
jgi:N-acyl-D-amino-acid deacylase